VRYKTQFTVTYGHDEIADLTMGALMTASPVI